MCSILGLSQSLGYLVSNSHLAGFDKHRQQILAALFLVHRRKIDVDRLTPLVGELVWTLRRWPSSCVSAYSCVELEVTGRVHSLTQLDQGRIVVLPEGLPRSAPVNASGFGTRECVASSNWFVRQNRLPCLIQDASLITNVSLKMCAQDQSIIDATAAALTNPSLCLRTSTVLNGISRVDR